MKVYNGFSAQHKLKLPNIRKRAFFPIISTRTAFVSSNWMRNYWFMCSILYGSQNVIIYLNKSIWWVFGTQRKLKLPNIRKKAFFPIISMRTAFVSSNWVRNNWFMCSILYRSQNLIIYSNKSIWWVFGAAQAQIAKYQKKRVFFL